MNASNSSDNGLNFNFTGKRISHKDTPVKNARRKITREIYHFAKHPYSGFVRRWKSSKDNNKPYNYIQKSHWHMVMQFLRTH